MTAPVDDCTRSMWLWNAELAAMGALLTANRRLVRKLPRAVRHHTTGLRTVDPLQWHTRLVAQAAVAAVDVDELLDGALAVFHRTTPPERRVAAGCVADAILSYLRRVISEGSPYDRDALARVIDATRCLDGEIAQQRVGVTVSRV